MLCADLGPNKLVYTWQTLMADWVVQNCKTAKVDPCPYCCNENVTFSQYSLLKLARCVDSFHAALWSRVQVLGLECGASQHLMRCMTWHRFQALQRGCNSRSRLLHLKSTALSPRLNVYAIWSKR